MIPASTVHPVSPSSSSGNVGLWGYGWRIGLGLAIAGLGSGGLALLPWATSAAFANGLCEVEANGTATSAVCCNGQAVQGTIPNLSTDFAQDICQILTMPTASRSEGENFLNQIEPDSLLTHTSPSAEVMTLPSLWWTRDSIPSQLGRHRLVDSWMSYTIQSSEVRVVDVMINAQFWRALTMPQRYGVLTKFGISAQEFGYHLRFFQGNGYSARMIGLYSCATPTGETALLSETTTATTTSCLVSVDTPQLVQWQQAVMPNPDRSQPARLPASTVDVAETPLPNSTGSR